jgi:hypothetical protein
MRKRNINRRHRWSSSDHMWSSVETSERESILIEQRAILILTWGFGLLLGWPLLAADFYTGSQRYRRSKYIEAVDIGIWMFSSVVQLVWIVSILVGIISLFTQNGGS